MSTCARHGKLHDSQKHIHDLLLNNGFVVEHENVYYSKILDGNAPASDISLLWREESAGSCREFAAVQSGREVCWGQVHFLPQGDIAYLRWIFTDGACQHQVIGTKVMYALFAHLYRSGIRRFDTDTAKDNLPAQKYYEKCGFTNEGITRSYYTK
jgi:ribosomal protein S18 acetylase RimI-like enzyme